MSAATDKAPVTRAPDEKSPSSGTKKAAVRSESTGGMVDLFRFLLENKKWWLLPIVIMFVLLMGVVVLGATELAPFIYTVF